jgi:hypothetical protein
VIERRRFDYYLFHKCRSKINSNLSEAFQRVAGPAWLVHSIVKTVHIPEVASVRLFRCFLRSREGKKLAHLARRIEESQIAGLTPVSGSGFPNHYPRFAKPHLGLNSDHCSAAEFLAIHPVICHYLAGFPLQHFSRRKR